MRAQAIVIKGKRHCGTFSESPMRISHAIIEFETKLRKEESLRKRVDPLEKNLSKQAKKKYFITIA